MPPGRPILRPLLGLAVAVVLLAVGPARPDAGLYPLQAATFTVNSTDDLVDANPGNGRCETAPGGDICTLRAAIMEANARQGMDVIVIPAGVYVLRRGAIGQDDDFAATGDLNITSDLTITGAGAESTIIDGNGLHRVFDIAPFTTVNISKLTLRNGNEFNGSALSNWGNLTLIDVTVRHNVAGGSGSVLNGGTLHISGSTISDNSAGRGAGVANLGTLTISNSTIRSNTAQRYGGAITNDPGGTVTLHGVIIADNRAESCCGGIGNGGQLTITNSTISGNTAHLAGGISNNHRGATTTITNSTISGNTANESGGGIVNVGPLVLTNVTLSGNTAKQSGGGLFNGSFEEGHGTATLTNVTISENTAGRTGGGLFAERGSTVQLKNTLLAKNTSGENCAGAVISLGHNLEDGPTCTLGGPGDLSIQEARLGPLADNGGVTHTHALLEGSAAIDAGDANGCPITDQRGVPRPQGAACDIGAYEFGAFPATKLAPSQWLNRPPGSVEALAVCPTASHWALLYWGGADRTLITVAADSCPHASLYWTNRRGRWLGFSRLNPAASDTWSLFQGEAHFLLGRSTAD